MIYSTEPTALDQASVHLHPAVGQQVNWSQLTSLPVDPAWMESQRIVSFQRRHKAALAYDIMRTKLLKDARENNWRTIGITAPTAGCGKATVAANLAISLTKHDKLKVAIIDLDLRRPHIAQIFAHNGHFTTDEFLRGECLMEDFLVRIGDNLAIGASPDPISYPAELLHGQGAAHILERLRDQLGADIIIYSLPSLLESDDCLGLLPLMEASLLVVGAEYSTVADIDITERELQAQTRLIGVVLNKCRFTSDQNTNFQI
ncbi:CpsD/CapB family tyrosine-protein kinase [Devosia sp. 2618]|uniref:CpsD/CapB family tyrosine-protein kinase n=1 Tax=Devosia sp. 2618 TaxID=3156454 RepID=UPI003391DFB1